MKRLSLLVLVLCLVLLLVPSLAQAAKPSLSQTLDQLWAKGYPQAIDQHLYQMPGTNPLLGFSWAGTWADNARAFYVADLMRDMGLKRVHLERVPVDVFTFKSATVRVGDRTMVASTFAGIRPTPSKGLTGQVVWAHEGTKADFDTLAAAGVSVKGKLVIVDADPTRFWMNCPAGEATLRGAKGVIFTFGPTTAPYWTHSPDVLGSFDGTYNMKFVPAVYISQQDGAWLESQISADGVGPRTTMRLIEKVRMASDGGFGFNVIGDLPGCYKDDSFVLWASHHDVHFKAADDDAACVATEMAIAKAMVMSRYHPAHRVRFLVTTAEEFGYTNAYNDWCIGAWWAITHAHRDWAGKIRAFFNMDYFSGSVPLGLASPDFAPLLKADAAANAGLLTNGCNVSSVQITWQDGWTFGAAGVPTVSIGSVPPDTNYGRYHTQYMVPSNLDWPWIKNISKFVAMEADKFAGKGLLPYTLKAQADDLSAGVSSSDLLAAGAKPANVSRLTNDIVAFQNAAAAYEARAPSIPASHAEKVNHSLRRIEKVAGVELLGMNPFQITVWRHSQALLDVQCLNAAIGALQAKPADTATAIGALAGVDFTYYGLMLSHPVYLQVMAPLNPHYDRVAWGGQANPQWPLLDVLPQIDAIQGGTWNQHTIDQLSWMRDKDLKDLNCRLNAMSAAVECITQKIDKLQ